LKILTGHENAVYHAVFSPDGKRIISASEDGSIKVGDIK
jgi:WD40 repeat protein